MLLSRDSYKENILITSESYGVTLSSISVTEGPRGIFSLAIDMRERQGGREVARKRGERQRDTIKKAGKHHSGGWSGKIHERENFAEKIPVINPQPLFSVKQHSTFRRDSIRYAERTEEETFPYNVSIHMHR